VYDLQGEVAVLKSLKDMPLQLQKIIMRSIQTKKGKIFECVDANEEPVKKRNKSKVRVKRDKSSEKMKDYADINGALDRMQELEAQNELIMLEQQKYKDEILEYQATQKVHKSRIEDLEEQVKTLERKHAENVKVIANLERSLCEVNDDLDRQAEQAKRLADLNEELRKLFEEERRAMGEE